MRVGTAVDVDRIKTEYVLGCHFGTGGKITGGLV
jgi:hypothetical protein